MLTRTRVAQASIIAITLAIGSVASAMPSAHSLDTAPVAAGDKSKDKAKAKDKHKPPTAVPHKPSKPSDKPKH